VGSWTLHLTSIDPHAGRHSEAAAALEAVDESVGEARGRNRLEGSRAVRRSEAAAAPEVADEIFGGVRGGRRTAGEVLSRLDASRDGVEGFERSEGGFGCGLAAERPCLGDVEGVGGGLAVLGTDEDRNSQGVAAVGLVEVVLGRAGAVEAGVRRAMRITEPPMGRRMDRCQMGGVVHLASLHKPKRGDGQEEEALLAGSSLLRRVVWEWARGSSSASHEGR
jgi:hypothetical protein